MFWADKIAESAKEKFEAKIKEGKPLVIRDEKTLSGRVHIGSLRGVTIHGVVSEVLSESKIKNKFLFELNDFDPMDGLPVYVDQEKFLPYMGFPLYKVPSPDGLSENFAEYFGNEFAGVIKDEGFEPEYYRSSELYLSGKYNEMIRLALDGADKIRKIYKDISGSVKEDKWLPLSVICENCGKVGTTRASNWDGKEVSYECGDFVEWGKGCGHKGKISPFDGKAKLPWKVEWAAKFTILDVDIEGGGKDHSTKGGSREIADTISREVFKREPPLNIPYEFFQIAGKKMSSSKGRGSFSRDIADLLPAHILRLLLMKDPNRVIEFDPEGDTVPILYDTYDTNAKKYFGGIIDDVSRAFPFYYPINERGNIKSSILPRFSLIAFLAQMPHLSAETEVEKMEGRTLTNDDKSELNLRIKYAKKWLSDYAPENYKFEIQKEIPAQAKDITEAEKDAVKEVLKFIESKQVLDGQELHTGLHEIKTRLNIEPKVLFKPIYLATLGKESGPKAGWFLSVLDRDFLIKRFKEAIK